MGRHGDQRTYVVQLSIDSAALSVVEIHHLLHRLNAHSRVDFVVVFGASDHVVSVDLHKPFHLMCAGDALIDGCLISKVQLSRTEQTHLRHVYTC